MGTNGRMKEGGYITVVNFDKHQHYKGRRPPWVKFYTSLLDPMNPINELPIEARFLFDRLLLLAANYENSIPNSYELIAKLVNMDSEAVRESLWKLEKGKWIRRKQTNRRASKRASSVLAACVQNRATESESESESEKEQQAVNPVLEQPPTPTDCLPDIHSILQEIT